VTGQMAPIPSLPSEAKKSPVTQKKIPATVARALAAESSAFVAVDSSRGYGPAGKSALEPQGESHAAANLVFDSSDFYPGFGLALSPDAGMWLLLSVAFAVPSSFCWQYPAVAAEAQIQTKQDQLRAQSP